MNSKRIYKQFNLVVNVGKDADIHKVVEQILVTANKAGANGRLVIEIKGAPEHAAPVAPLIEEPASKPKAPRTAPEPARAKPATKKAAPAKKATTKPKARK